MRAFYVSRISENISKTPEGYLVCTGVPIARTGWQSYLGSELGLDADSGNSEVKVWRAPDEVFSPQTIASFEGKSVTEGHPPELLRSDNEGSYNRGHAQHIRRGGTLENGEESLLADLVIKDANLVSKVEGGLREISCGYECEYVPDEQGGYVQRSIRGNHIALVPNGRAGSTVAIRDEKTLPPIPTKKVKVKNWKSHLIGLGLKTLAKDAEPEELAEAAKSAKEEDAKDVEFYGDPRTGTAHPIRGSKGYSKKKAGDAEEEEPGKKKGEAKDWHDGDAEEERPDPLARLADAIDGLVEHLKGSSGAKDAEQKPDEEEREETGDSDLIPVETLPAEERPKAGFNTGGSDTLQVLLSIKPAIAKSNDKAAIAAWNDAYRKAKNPASSKTGDAYRSMADPKKPQEVATAETRAGVGLDGFNDPIEANNQKFALATEKARQKALGLPVSKEVQ